MYNTPMQKTITIGNRYIIEDLGNSLLGRGGMGDVFQGQDLQTQTAVAIKRLKSEIVAENHDAIIRFVREGEALRQLNHPNIVKMLESITVPATDTIPPTHYLIMEYVSGGSLRDRLNQQGQLSQEEVLSISLELADALTRAHH